MFASMAYPQYGQTFLQILEALCLLVAVRLLRENVLTKKQEKDGAH